MAIEYINKSKQDLKERLIKLSENLNDIHEMIIQFKDKEGNFHTSAFPSLNSYELMIHKSNLECLISHKVVEENF